MQFHRASINITILLATISLRLANASEPETEDILAGHSFHGEAFNDGPRQAAYLMPGLAGISFPASTDSERAQQFINQGVAQLHGFWYYEAERSFRQASMLDPDCAICYWGMAQANIENRSRAQKFIATAMEKLEEASEREKMYIEAANKYFEGEASKNKKDRAQKYTSDLEAIVIKFPDDIEARAFLALQLYHNTRSDLPIVSYVAVDSILQDVFDANPSHPAHHYRIHLWDRQQAENALASAAACGPSLPAVAHMWHMPGHIYSRLNRYNDAAWQQEASARVDHAHMMRDRVLPDQIHNFAHNNEWLIRNLVKLGRVNDAMSLAKNMLELPQHPKYNSSTKGSTKFGRERLLLTLKSFRLWDDLIALSETDYLPPTDSENLQIERLHLLAVAHGLSRSPSSSTVIDEIEAWKAKTAQRIEEIEQTNESAKQEEAPVEPSEVATLPEDQKTPPSDPSTPDSDGPASTPENPVNETSETDGAAKTTEATATEDSATVETASERALDPSAATSEANTNDLSEANASDSSQEVPEAASEKPNADEQKSAANRAREKKARDAELKKLNERTKKLEKAILAHKTSLAAANENWQEALEGWKASGFDDELLRAEWRAAAGEKSDALKAVNAEIKKLPGEVLPVAVKVWVQYTAGDQEAAIKTFEELRPLASTADLDTPLLARLAPIAAAAGYPNNWAAKHEVASDIGARPDLDSLGPFRWRPYLLPKFSAIGSENQQLSRADIVGTPTVIIFYLGFGCLHCVEQLHAFSPKVEAFRENGINVVAISCESLESLNEGLTDFGKDLNIPLHADPSLDAFRAFRCHDDFEQQPLHGTFVIASDGRVLWQDIGYEPFMDVDFVLTESQRLLKLHSTDLQ